METLQAIQSRHSVRDFLSQPVPQKVVMQILEIATRCPSGGNGQPWELFVASGSTLETIRSAYQERYQNRSARPAAVPAGGPPAMPEFLQKRMQTIRSERMRLIGLDPDDPASGKVFMQWGSRLFGVPVLVVLCMDHSLSSNFDLGMLAQTICLAAQNFGVESLIASAFVAQPDILCRELEIPENLKIVTGIGLGYANPENLINTYRSPRRPLEEVVRYKD
jgi:nitroreductase